MVPRDDVAKLLRSCTAGGVLKRDMRIHDRTVPKSSTVRAVGDVRVDPKADMLSALESDEPDLEVDFPHKDSVLHCVLHTSAQRQDLQGHLNNHLQTTWLGIRSFRSPEGTRVLVPRGASLLRVGVFQRSGYKAIFEELSKNSSAAVLLTVVKNVNTQAMEQHWRIFNRHKATFRHLSKACYLYLLHRLGHLLNVKRWAPAGVQ
jgi:hypothetical protein